MHGEDDSQATVLCANNTGGAICDDRLQLRVLVQR